jgi:hypothetical protein
VVINKSQKLLDLLQIYGCLPLLDCLGIVFSNTIPDKTGTFVLDTDASDKAIRAELIQIQNGQERVVAYGSFTLSPAQGRYCWFHAAEIAQIPFPNFPCGIQSPFTSPIHHLKMRGQCPRSGLEELTAWCRNCSHWNSNISLFILLKSAFLYSQTFLIQDLFSKQGIFIFIKVASWSLEMVVRGIPSRLVRIRLNDKPWFNSEIRKEIRTRNRLHWD